MKVKRENIWGIYLKLRTSTEYTVRWSSFLHKIINTEACLIFQYITNFVLKEMIKRQYPIEPKESAARCAYHMLRVTVVVLFVCVCCV